jgi:rod shape-determining protein MreC
MAPGRDRRTGFSRRRQYGLFIGYVLAVAGAVLGAALLLASRFNPPAFAALRMGAASITAPVSGALAWAIGGVASVPASIGDYFAVYARNKALTAELERTRALLTRARVIAYDNRRLTALLRLRERGVEPVVTARLVSSTASSGRRFALLNAGRWQGVLPGMPVRGPEGVVGRVVETGPAVARVLLLTDAESLIPVRRTRDGLPAIVAGRGDGTVEVRSVATSVRFQPGELFVTTGTGGIYPPGIPTARTVRGGLDAAEARPIALPDSLDYALVQRPFMPLPPPPPGRGR